MLQMLNNFYFPKRTLANLEVKKSRLFDSNQQCYVWSRKNVFVALTDETRMKHECRQAATVEEKARGAAESGHPLWCATDQLTGVRQQKSLPCRRGQRRCNQCRCLKQKRSQQCAILMRYWVEGQGMDEIANELRRWHDLSACRRMNQEICWKCNEDRPGKYFINQQRRRVENTYFANVWLPCKSRHCNACWIALVMNQVCFRTVALPSELTYRGALASSFFLASPSVQGDAAVILFRKRSRMKRSKKQWSIWAIFAFSPQK